VDKFARLRDRTVRDAMVYVPHGGMGWPNRLYVPPCAEATAKGPQAAVGLVLTSGSVPVAANLVTRPPGGWQALAVLDQFDIAIFWGRQPAQHSPLREKGTTMPTEQQIDQDCPLARAAGGG
jgi:hypothetical protein